MALDTSIGTLTANSYATLAEADTYHSTRLHNAQWAAAEEADKEVALLWATRMLDNGVEFVGRRYGLHQEQALQWPRYGVFDSNRYYIEEDVIPKQVKDAQCELAWLLLQSDRTSPSTGAAVASIRDITVGPIKLGFNESKDTIDVIPRGVIDLLQGLGVAVSAKGPKSIRLLRA